MSGNLAVETPSLKLCIINSEKISRFALITFTGISFCWMALDASSESISLSTSSTSTAETKMPLMVSLHFYCTWMILKLPDNTIYWFVTYRLLRHKFTINTYIFHLNVSATSLSSETTLSPSIRVILSLPPTFLEKKRFHGIPKLFIIRDISYIEVIIVIFHSFSNHFDTRIPLFVISLFTFLRFCLQKFIA